MIHRRLRTGLWMLLGLVPSIGWAAGNVSDACDADGDGKVDNYDPSVTSEDAQTWNLSHATALGMALSPVNVPASYKPMRVNLSLELDQIKYLTCQEQAVLDGTKTEDTNKTPLAPRPRLTLALPMSWISIVGLPPVKLFGVKTGVIGGEVGFGLPVPGAPARVGARLHAVGGQIIGDIAHPYGAHPGDPGYEDLAIDDEYQFYTAGVDVSAAVETTVASRPVGLYLGGGVLKSNTIFYIGEDAYEVFTGDYFLKYYHEELGGTKLPGFLGPDFFAGLRVEPVSNVDLGLEFFFIPVRMSMPEELDVDGAPNPYTGNYGSLRVRAGYTFGND